MKTTILDHTGTDGLRLTVSHVETQRGSGVRGDLIEVTSNTDASLSTYDVLIKLAHVLANHERILAAEEAKRHPPALTEEGLDEAMSVVLRHSVGNVVNAFLKTQRDDG